MNKIAFIFPGQGVQTAGMGKDFYENSQAAREVFDLADQVLSMDIKALCFEENEKLNLTEYTQAALVTTCLSIEAAVREQGLLPQVTAGLSLGEYCAIVSAGGMKREVAVQVVRERGILMEQAVPEGQGAMAAILGMTGEQIEEILKGKEDVFIANYNCPGQIVITGKKEAVEQAKEELLNQGAKRAVSLKVSGPFHSPYLKEAGERLGKVLETVDFKELLLPYVSNVTAEYVTDIKETKELLIKQVASSVRWQQSVEKMLAEGIDTFVEIGPGKTLAGFIRKINRQVKVHNISTWEDLEKTAEEWRLKC